MSERLTKEREAEIRAYYRGEAQSSYYVPPEPGDYALADVLDLLAEIDALRAAPPTTYLRADGTEEPIGELVARLTRERDGWRLRADDLTSQRDGQERDAIAARAEAGAERKARVALEARVRELLDAHAKLLDRLETAKARVRELEAERDAALSLSDLPLSEWPADARDSRHALELREVEARVRALEAERSAWASSAGRWAGEATAQEDARHVAEAGLSVSETVRRHDEATLAETRAQLARLREAALMLSDRVRAEGGHGHRVHELSDRVLDALSTPGPTLADIRQAAQAEVLREMARRTGTGLGHHTSAFTVGVWLDQRADDIEAGRE